MFVNINFTLDSLQDFSLWFSLPVESRLKKQQCFDMNSSQLKFGKQPAPAAKSNQQNNFIQAPKAFPLIFHKCQLFQRPVLQLLGEFLTDICRLPFVPLKITFVLISRRYYWSSQNLKISSEIQEETRPSKQNLFILSIHKESIGRFLLKDFCNNLCGKWRRMHHFPWKTGKLNKS